MELYDDFNSPGLLFPPAHTHNLFSATLKGAPYTWVDFPRRALFSHNRNQVVIMCHISLNFIIIESPSLSVSLCLHDDNIAFHILDTTRHLLLFFGIIIQSLLKWSGIVMILSRNKRARENDCRHGNETWNIYKNWIMLHIQTQRLFNIQHYFPKHIFYVRPSRLNRSVYARS